jgi:hypothetical protein
LNPLPTTGGGGGTVVGSSADNSPNTTTKLPVIPAVANAAAPVWTEGYQVPLSVDLTGALRVSGTSGGGIAQLQVRSGVNAWTDIGYFAGDLNVPVQGIVTANAGTGNFTVVQPTGANLHVVVDSSALVQVQGTVTVVQPTGTSLHTVLDSGTLTGITNPIHVIPDTSAVVVQNFPSTQTIQGTVTVVQPTGTSLHTVLDSGTLTGITNTVIITGTDADNAVNSTTKVPTIPARANASSPAWTEGREAPLSVDLTGALRVTGSSGGGIAQMQVRDAANAWTDIGYFAGDLNVPVQGTVTVNAGTGNFNVVQPAGTNLHVVVDSSALVDVQGNVTVIGTASDNSINSLLKLPVISARANAAFQVWTEGNQVPLSTDLSGAVRMLVTQGSNVAIVKTTSPVGTDARLVVGNIPRKETQTLTTTPLAALAEYNSGWFDSQASGTVYVTASALSNVASIQINGFIIEQSDVNNDENMVSIIESHGVGSNELKVIIAEISQRYWRVRYFNNQVAQTSFKLTVTESVIAHIATNLNHEDTPAGVYVPESLVGLIGGQTTNNYYRALRMDNDNRLISGLPDLYSMFNEMLKELKLITLHLHNITEEEIDTYDVEGVG